ncbi:MAG: hypothetical protein VB013_02615, partial [Anaerolineaceae bacterium]|nr:hypothetical protein [Anaerolineaceae bacterium]
MKFNIKRLLIAALALILCSSCQGLNSVPISSTPTVDIAKESLATLTPRPKLPQWFVDSLPTNIQTLEPFMDIRGYDLENYQKPIDRSLIETFWYDGATNWPSSVVSLANQVLEEGKNPGLGVRDLHAQGITGKGVSVAIIDQPLGLNHPEYKGRIFVYKYFNPTDKKPQSDLHGPAVASLLVGTNTGTAPDAKLY